MTACPRCGKAASLHGPSYPGTGPPIFKCYSCDVYGYGFHDSTPEAWAESDASRAQSRANADARRSDVHANCHACPTCNGCRTCGYCGCAAREVLP